MQCEDSKGKVKRRNVMRGSGGVKFCHVWVWRGGVKRRQGEALHSTVAVGRSSVILCHGIVKWCAAMEKYCSVMTWKGDIDGKEKLGSISKIV